MSASTNEQPAGLLRKRQSYSVEEDEFCAETEEEESFSERESDPELTPGERRKIRKAKEKRGHKSKPKRRRIEDTGSISHSLPTVEEQKFHESYCRNSLVGTVGGVYQSRVQLKVKFRDISDLSYVPIFDSGVLVVDDLTIKRFSYFLARSSKDWAAFIIWCWESFHGDLPFRAKEIFIRAICYHYALIRVRGDEEVFVYCLLDDKPRGYEWQLVSSEIDWNSYDKKNFQLMGTSISYLSFQKFKKYKVPKDKTIRGEDFEEDD